MLGKAADINSKGANGYTALHLAAESSHFNVVKELLKNKDIEVDAVTDSQKTPLHLAAIGGNYEIFEHLCLKGANLHAKDFNE